MVKHARSRSARAGLRRFLSPIVTLAVGGAMAPLLAPTPAAGQERSAYDEQAGRIARIENGLLMGLQVEGRDSGPFTLEERMRYYGVPGVSVAVMEGGRILWAKGYGVEEAGTDRRVTAETLFQAASISKPVAALGALRLVDRGDVALDEDVNRWLRSWRVPAADAAKGKPVTLRGLVTHTAGLTVHGFPGYASRDEVPGTVGVLKGEGNTAAILIDTEPGTLWRYSGGGYTVMQLLVEDVTGKPFAEAMQELVLEPLGMRLSTYAQPLPLGLRAQAATGHEASGDPIFGRFHTYPEQAAAGLWTNPTDLLRYAQGVQAALAGEDGAVLSRAVAADMVNAGMGEWGLGPRIDGTGAAKRFSHGGANEGFRAQFEAFTEGGRGAVVMTNSDTGGALAAEVLRAIFREYGWAGYEGDRLTPVAGSGSKLAEYAGVYRIEGMAEERVTMRLEEGRLMVDVPRMRENELILVGEDEVVAFPQGFRFRFTRDAAGEVTGARGPAVLVRVRS